MATLSVMIAGTFVRRRTYGDAVTEQRHGNHGGSGMGGGR